MGSENQFYFYDCSARKFLPLWDGIVFGRTEGDERYPKDRAMSTQHCRVHVVKNDVYVEDLKSTNGTRVNAVRIEPSRRRRLQLDDVIVVGKRRFILSHQNQFAPAHAETTRMSKDILGGRTLGGSLTGGLSKVLKEKTGRMLARRELAVAKIEQFSHARKWPVSTTLVLVGAAGFWTWNFIELARGGGLHFELLYGVTSLLARYALLAVATTYVAVLGHYLVANVLFRGRVARLVLLPITAATFWALATGGDSLVALSRDARINAELRECLTRQKPDACWPHAPKR